MEIERLCKLWYRTLISYMGDLPLCGLVQMPLPGANLNDNSMREDYHH